MSDIQKRLRASLGFDAINGSEEERAVCAKQMSDAATHIDTLESDLARVTAELAACKEENEALRKDAERYRWLRENSAEANRVYFDFAGNMLDAAIDAAIKEGPNADPM